MQRGLRFGFVLPIFLIFVYPVVSLGASDYTFKTWNTENGLPQNSVQAIAQTPDGYIWVATRDGLARFDGLRFKIFQRSNTPELPTNRLEWITTDDVGRLWIFPEANPQLVVYENGSFRAFTKGVDYDFDGEPENWTEGDATIFSSKGIDYVYREGTFTRRAPVTIKRELGIDPKDHAIWIDDGSNYYSITGTTVRVHPRDGSNPLTLGTTAPVTAYVMYEEPNVEGRLSKSGYARNKDSFWFFVDGPKGRALARFRRGKLELSNFLESRIVNMLLDRSGNLWMGHLNNGIYRVDARSMDSDDITHLQVDHIGPSEGLAGNAVLRLFKDRDENLWIGGYEGLQLLKDDRIVNVISARDGLPSDNIYGVAQDAGGAIWFGAWGIPCWAVRYDEGSVRTFEMALPTAITFDSSGDPIFGANGRLWKITGGHIEQLFLPGFSRTGFNMTASGQATLPGTPTIHLYERPVNEISFIHTDSHGNFWIGGIEGLLEYYDGQMKRWTLADGLPSNSMAAFLETRSGQIWIGTTSGLARLDGDHFTAFRKADGLGGDFVRSLYEDKNGVLWVGTYDSGIIRYKDGQFRTIDKKDGLFSDGVFCILEDDDGWLWMNSNQGIHRARRQDLNDFADGRISTVTSAGYGIEDGLLNVEGNGGKQPAGLRSTDGRLWFPTAGGLAVIDPKRVHRDEQAPNVLIEEIKVDQKDLPNTDKVVVAPGQTALEINYTGIKFNNSERLRFRYRLEGLDDGWTEAGTRRTAYFSHLPYGDYTFRVLAANRDGVWNEQGAGIRIVIDRPYYRTYWFYAIAAFFAAGFIGLVYFARVRHLRSVAEARELYTRQLLESQERERSRLAMELHDSLGQSLVVIRNRALLGISKGKDDEAMLAQLHEISDASASALQETREIAHTLHPYQIEALGLSTALQTLIDKFANSSKIEFNVDIDSKPGDLPQDLSIAVYRIVQEWLTNVVKHSSANQVSVILHRNGAKLELSIKDDGVGFDPQTVKRGLGLKGIEERARMSGASLNISSVPGSGAGINLVVDLPEKNG
jgi:signal transduction histidine kinase/ligand-binding sensor domain-containing protein